MNEVFRREQWLSIFWTLLGIAICIGAYRLSLGSPHDPGPGMFAFIAGAALTLLSLIQWINLAIAHARTKALSSQAADSQAIEPLFANKRGAIKAAVIVVAPWFYFEYQSLYWVSFVVGRAPAMVCHCVWGSGGIVDNLSCF